MPTLPKMRFTFVPAEDESVDPEYRLIGDDGQETSIAIQDASAYGAGFAVNEYGPDDNFSVRTIGAATSLPKAKALAVKHYVIRLRAQ
jgi:hypothetical protein